MTFTQQVRAYWAEALRADAGPHGFDRQTKLRWALRCLVLEGPVGKLP